MSDAAAPIMHGLRCSADHAFAADAGRISEWWDPRYSANVETLEGVTIEPRVGGRVFATHSDIGEHEWGRVTGRRLHGALAHGGWTEENVATRGKFGDWPVLLERFRSLSEP